MLIVQQKLNRPALPTSIKKLNRLLSHDRSIPIPASDLIERFVKGRGPGGQAINKTNSSVSLTHIPTGIRIQSQPTRSREENRKIARKILAEKLDLLRAHETARLREPEPDSAANNEGHVENGGGLKKSRKENETEMAGVWSRDEIRWEKERRRKVNKAKKTKKKRKESAVDLGDEPTQEDQGANSSAPDR
jgi:protein subunit release factor B